MKNVFLFIVAFLFAAPSFSQEVSVEGAIDQLGQGYNSSYRVSIPHASVETVEKKWSGFIREHSGKSKSSKGKIKGENLIIKGLGPDTLQVYAQVDESKDGVLLKVAVQRGDDFISRDKDSGYSKKLESILEDFAINQSKTGLNVKIEAAAGLLLMSQKQQTNLEKTNENLGKEIESMKKKIADNEAKIAENVNASEALKLKIEEQQKGLDELKSKLTELN